MDLVWKILKLTWNISYWILHGNVYLEFSVGTIYLEVSVCMSMFRLVWRQTRERNGSGSVGKSLLSRGSAPFPGSERPVPGRAPLHAPRSPSRASAAILSPATPRADVWGGRGTVVVPRGVCGGARESQLFFGYVITAIFSKINLDIFITTTTTEQHYR